MQKLFFSAPLLVLALLTGCGDSGPKSDLQVKKPQPEDAAWPDKSLAAADYVPRGLPSCEKSWSAQDMVVAAKALAEIADKDPQELPRYQSARSGAVFARLTTADNLEPYRNQALPVKERISQAVVFFRSANDVFKLYLRHFMRKELGDNEVIELMGMQCRTAAMTVELLREFVPTLDKNDPTYFNRMAGLEEMRRGMTVMTVGMLQTFAERRHYRTPALQRLLSYLEEPLPRIFAELRPESRLELFKRLDDLIADLALADLRPGFETLRGALRAAADQADRGPGAQPGLQMADLEKKGLTMHRLQAGEPDSSGWCVAKSTLGGFAVHLPGKFNDFSQKLAADGKTAAIHVVGLATLQGWKYSAILIESAGGAKQTSLDDFARSQEGKEETKIEKRHVQIAGHPGIEIKVSTKVSAAAVRAFQTKDGLYQLIVEYPHFWPEAQVVRDTARFFESFSLEKKTR